MKKRWQPKSLWPRCPHCGLHAKGPVCTSKDKCDKTLLSFEVKPEPMTDEKPPSLLTPSLPSKQERKELLIEMMREDEKNGMYDLPSKGEQEKQEDEFLLHLVDVVACFATEQNMFYSTKTRKELIHKARETFNNGQR